MNTATKARRTKLYRAYAEVVELLAATSDEAMAEELRDARDALETALSIADRDTWIEAHRRTARHGHSPAEAQS